MFAAVGTTHMPLDKTDRMFYSATKRHPWNGGMTWAAHNCSRGGHASREPPETGPVIPVSFPDPTDRTDAPKWDCPQRAPSVAAQIRALMSVRSPVRGNANRFFVSRFRHNESETSKSFVYVKPGECATVSLGEAFPVSPGFQPGAPQSATADIRR
jgi:hypothetical protein